MEYKEILKDIIQETNEVFKDDPYKIKFHIIPVVEYSKRFAKRFNADEEVVEIAAYFHNITKLIGNKEYYHITGAEFAREFLTSRKYAKNKTDLVSKCILNHRGSIYGKRNSIEEKIIATADAVVNLDYMILLLFKWYGKKQLSLEDGEKKVREKLEKCWKKIEIEEIKNEYQNKYDYLMSILSKIEE